MPKIRTYEQQVGIAQPTRQSFESADAAAAPGEALARLGGAVQGFGEVLHKNDVQDDITNSHQSLSTIRNAYTKRIQEETQKGTINAEALHAEYQNSVNQLSGSVKTSEGQRYLDEKTLNLGDDLIRTAAISQAQVKGRLAVEQWQNTINLNGNTLQHDPAGFQQVLTDSVSALEAQVQDGSLDIDTAEKLKRVTGEQYAEQAVRGWAEINADTAKTLLDGGNYDKFLNPDQKAGLYGTIRAYKSAEATEVERQKKAQEERQKKVQEAWEQDNLDNLDNNSITPKEILAAPMTANRKIQWLNMMDKNLKEKLQTNPALKNSLIQRMMLPDGSPQRIVDRAQLYQHVGNGISLEDLKQMTSFLDNTPEGSRIKSNRKMLLDQADATLVKRDPITGQPDPQGPFSLSLYTNALLDAEEKQRAAGKDVNALYDPNSKDYFGHQILKFRSTPQEIFQRQFDMQEFTIPAGAKDVGRKAGESAADYLKRSGG